MPATYAHYEQVAATAVVKTKHDLTIPPSTTHVEVLAETQNVRYTMDGLTTPTQTTGMLLKTTDPPRIFLIDDILKIKFARGAGSDGLLNLHYRASS